MSRDLRCCFITDNGYIQPTAVAIASLLAHRDPETVCDIYVVAADLSEENERLFLSFRAPGVAVSVVRSSSAHLAALHRSDPTAMCVATPAALLKFSLCHLLPHLDKVLYLDGDILVRRDLADLYATDLGSAVLAAVPDSGAVYFKQEILKRVVHYFNSGVMLMNLRRMREEGYAERLTEAKRRSTDASLMDQNIFNLVCDRQIALLPVTCNCILHNLIRAYSRGNFTMADFNAFFGTRFRSLRELEQAAAIIHFASKDKPWKFYNVPLADEWKAMYAKTPLAKTPLSRAKQEGRWLRFDWRAAPPEAEPSQAPQTPQTPQTSQTSQSNNLSLGLVFQDFSLGGIQRVCSRLIPLFASAGYRVVALTTRDAANDLYAVDVPFERIVIGDDPSPTGRRARIREAVRAFALDLVVFHEYYAPTLPGDMAAVREAGVPCIVHHHNVFSASLLRHEPGVDEAAHLGLFAGADALITLSRCDARAFRLLGCNAHYLPNPLTDPPAEGRRASPCAEGGHSLLWMARGTAVKRPLDAVMILERVRERYPDADLWMLGDADTPQIRAARDYTVCRPGLAEAVHFEGPQKNVWPYVARADVFLSTASIEGFCYSILEAAAAGVPTVGYELPYLEVAQDNDGFLAVPQGDVAAAAGAVSDLFANAERLRRASDAARAAFARLRDFDQLAAYRRLFADAMRRHREQESLDALDVCAMRTLWNHACAGLGEVKTLLAMRTRHRDQLRAKVAEREAMLEKYRADAKKMKEKIAALTTPHKP